MASAAGPTAANLLKAGYTGVLQQQNADRLAALAKSSATVTVADATARIAPPEITDVVPLPADDSSGASLGFLTQAVALVGPAGALLGEFLPTGAGVTAVRDNLYFPTAPIGRPLLILALYAGVGCLLVLVTNLASNRSDRTAEFDLTSRERFRDGSAEPL